MSLTEMCPRVHKCFSIDRNVLPACAQKPLRGFGLIYLAPVQISSLKTFI